MKIISKYLTGILVLSGLAVSAQTSPKLALAEVSVTPTLADKMTAPTTQAGPPSVYANVLGAWKGIAGVNHWTITIKQLPAGTLQAFCENHTKGSSFFEDSLAVEGNHIKMLHGKTTVEGDVNPDFGIWKGVWTWLDPKGKPVSVDFTFHREPLSAPVITAPPVPLAELTHALGVQLFDRFKGEQFFSLMGDAELKRAIVPTGQPPNPPYDLSKADTAAQFKQAGINYLLVASVEDFTDQTIEKRRTKDFHYQTGLFYGTHTYDARFGRNGISSVSSGARAGVATQGGLDPEVWQQQTIRLTVRCQLFDATTGELKKSTTGTFPFQRDYTAVAQGANQLSTADLCEAAARTVSAWATILVDDAVFPIKVLAKNDQEITISRGTEAGLQTGQVFEVCVEGAEIKDPETGKVLGKDIKTVGRVMIAQVEPKFSHAKVLEDTGIVPGATLVRAAH
jgi:hypothetical protein